MVIGVDVGGTKISAGLLTLSGRIVATANEVTTPSGPLLAEVITGVVEELKSRVDGPIGAVGVGLPGVLDKSRGSLLEATHITRSVGLPLKQLLEDSVGLPVVLANDAGAAAWGEACIGAGRGTLDLICLTVGTGLGGGLVSGGQLHRGLFEPGHMILEVGGRQCRCSRRGCLEAYVSGTALAAEAKIFRVQPANTEVVTGSAITAAAQAGDEWALLVFEKVGQRLGRALALLASIIEPTRFIIGGGVSDAGELLLRPTRAAYYEYAFRVPNRPLAEVVKAELGNSAGFAGAALLAAADSGQLAPVAH
jgi:glucokinase